MALTYGFAKSKLASDPRLKAGPHRNEIQYHEHFRLMVNDSPWDVAVNVGTNDADDLLKYKLVYDFHHPIVQILSASPPGAHVLTGTADIPAIDYVRSDILRETADWRQSDVMDGIEFPQPAAELSRLLLNAKESQADVYIFGRFYPEGNGIHDTHLNQGSTGGFLHREGDDSNDHNDVWQDGAVLVDLGEAGWAAYFAAFNEQLVPTDDLGNPTSDGHTI